MNIPNSETIDKLESITKNKHTQWRPLRFGRNDFEDEVGLREVTPRHVFFRVLKSRVELVIENTNFSVCNVPGLRRRRKLLRLRYIVRQFQMDPFRDRFRSIRKSVLISFMDIIFLLDPNIKKMKLISNLALYISLVAQSNAFSPAFTSKVRIGVSVCWSRTVLGS